MIKEVHKGNFINSNAYICNEGGLIISELSIQPKSRKEDSWVNQNKAKREDNKNITKRNRMQRNSRNDRQSKGWFLERLTKHI